MSIEHMDNWSIYGSDIALLLNGLYASTTGISLLADPDGFSSGRVLRYGSTGGLYGFVAARRAFASGPVDVAGAAFRQWVSSLPAAANACIGWEFRGAGNERLCTIGVTSNGSIRACVWQSSGNSDFVEYGDLIPRVTANGWWHIEAKYTKNVGATCDVEICVEGQTVLNIAGVACRNIQPGQSGPGGFYVTNDFPSTYVKDCVWWNGLGAINNNFLGSVLVTNLKPTTDVALNWAKSSALFTGAQLIADLVPVNVLTASGAIANGNQVRLNTVYYNWTNGSVNAGAPAGTSANPWLVAMGASTADALANMFKAINASGVAGTDYSTAVVANPFIGATGVDATRLGVVALDNLTLYPVFETGTNTAWAAAALFVGVSDMSLISAVTPPPAAYVCELSNLPPDITSVRGLMSIVRAMKSDGGDGSLQVGLISAGNVDLGTDRPITVAQTYYTDICELSPDTGNPWTPPEVDSAQLQINRTT